MNRRLLSLSSGMATLLIASCSPSSSDFCVLELRGDLAKAHGVPETTIPTTCTCRDQSPSVVECRCTAELAGLAEPYYCEGLRRRGILARGLKACACRTATASDYLR